MTGNGYSNGNGNGNQRNDPLSQAKEFWKILVHKRWALLFWTVWLEAVAIVAICVAPSQYQASTTVFFDPQKLPDLYVAETVAGDPSQRLNTLTEEVLTSSRLLQISRQLNLFKGDNVAPSSIISGLRKSINIQMLKFVSSRELNSFVIQYTGKDPANAAAVANLLAQSFVDWDLANREQQATGAMKFMQEQLRGAQELLQSEQAKVNEYNVKYSGELPGQLPANMQAISMLHATLKANGEELDKLEQEKTMLEAVPEAGRSGVPSERDRLEAERQSLQAELASLRSRFTEQYPDVVATKDRLDAVTRALNDNKTSSAAVSTAAVRLQIIKRETQRLQEEQADLTTRINKYQAQVDAEPLRERELEALTRNYDKAREQYDELQDKKLQAGMAKDLEDQQKSSHFTIDRAQVPDEPLKPNRPLLFALLLPLCAMIPAGVSIGIEQMRRKINSEQSLRSLLPDHVRIVGSIPMMQTPSATLGTRRLATMSIVGSIICFIGVTGFLLQRSQPKHRLTKSASHAGQEIGSSRWPTNQNNN